MSAASRTLLLSQGGPHSARACAVSPHVRRTRHSRLEFPYAVPGLVFERGPLDEYGDHRAACSTSGVLPSRALPLECAIVSGGWSARVRVALSNIDVHGARRIEVACNGRPMWHRAQLAVDAALVSLVTRDGRPQAGPDARGSGTCTSHGMLKLPVSFISWRGPCCSPSRCPSSMRSPV